MVTTNTRKGVTVRTAEELGRTLRLSVADIAEMEFRSELTVALAKIIQTGRLTTLQSPALAHQEPESPPLRMAICRVFQRMC